MTIKYGAIEAGGTKFVCGVGTEDLSIIDRVSFPTTTPAETMKLVVDYFKQYDLEAIGIGSFGPIDLNKKSPTYGYITTTPKLAWANFDFLGEMKEHFNIPMAWTTDVNAAAYGEYIAGRGQGVSSCVYYTFGTGVGAGAIQNGSFIEGFSHPEMGHMRISRHPDDAFEGSCPFHGCCLEGMAAGPAIEKRTGKKGQTLSKADPVWDIVAYYIAQAVYNTTLMLSPEVIILGGGVMKQEQLYEKIKENYKQFPQGYVKTPPLDEYIVSPALGDNQGTIGCLALAKDAAANQ